VKAWKMSYFSEASIAVFQVSLTLLLDGKILLNTPRTHFGGYGWKNTR